jgi:hypothetical protein
MSGIALAILFVGGAGAYGMLGVILGRRFIHRHVADGHNDVLVPLFAATGVICDAPWLLGRRRLAGL